MTEDKGILIKNIYYMLAYAFETLNRTHYEEISGEEFDNCADLFAAILAKGVAHQLKQGLYREYAVRVEKLNTLRGKIDINDSMKEAFRKKRSLTCEFDELTENNLLNRILKTTMAALLKSRALAFQRRRELHRVYLFFDGVDEIAPDEIVWSAIRFRRNNQTYKMLMNICYFVLDGMLQTTQKGEYRMAAFSDEHMAKLYERFILEYYKKHFPSLCAQASQVKWNLDETEDMHAIRFLPVMQTDITLTNGKKTLIIDAKYYSRTMQTRFERETMHSANLYQIYTYVKNKDVRHDGSVSGMLLYAKTGEAITPDFDFSMDGNTISGKTLNLNADFSRISESLNGIAQGLIFE